MHPKRPILVVENDVWACLVAVVLDRATSKERSEGYADFMSPDEPDIGAWCERVRHAAGPLASLMSRGRSLLSAEHCSRCGHLGGFALDPQYEEPGRSDDELLAFDNVVLTTHDPIPALTL